MAYERSEGTEVVVKAHQSLLTVHYLPVCWNAGKQRIDRNE
jgi:hypothetical protein